MGVCALLDKIVRKKSFSEKVIFGHDLKRVSHMEMWEKSTPGRVNSNYKDPGMILGFPVSGKACVTGVESVIDR